MDTEDDLELTVPDELLEAAAGAQDSSSIIRSAKSKSDDAAYEEIENVDDWLACMRQTDNPVLQFALLFRLPHVCQNRTLTDDQVDAIIREIPTEVLSDLIMTDSPDTDVTVELVTIILEVFLPLTNAHHSPLDVLQPGLAYNLINRELGFDLFERVVVCCCRLGSDGLSLDDAVSVLNQSFRALVTNTSKLPTIELLQCVIQLVDRLALNPVRGVYLSSNAGWLRDSATVIQRLFQTYRLPENVTDACFELASSILQLMATKWLDASERDKFPLLLCSLSSGRLRIFMEEPSQVRPPLIVPLLSILEFFMDAVDDSAFFNDDEATKISYHIKEAATFLLDYLTECRRSNLEIPENVMTVTYKFVCSFLSIGGSVMLAKSCIEGALPSLTAFARESLAASSTSTTIAAMLLYNLPSLPTLTAAEVGLIHDFAQVAAQHASGDAQNVALSQVSSILEQLVARKDAFSADMMDVIRRIQETCMDDRIRQLCFQFLS